MGRGGNENGNGAVVTRGLAPATVIELARLGDGDATRVGEVIELPGGGTLELTADDPAQLLVGLSEVESVLPELDGTHRVSFNDGTEALVDLERGAVAFNGECTESRTTAALHAALAERCANSPEELAAGYADLNRARAAFSDDRSAANYRAYAGALQAIGREELPADATVDPSDLTRRLAGEPAIEPKPSSRLRAAQEKLKRVLSGPQPSAAAYAILHQVDESSNEVKIPVEAFAERAEAAKRLGGEHLIPELRIDIDEDPESGELISKGDYHFGFQEQEVFALLRNRMAVGQRFFLFRGPPGTGKDACAQQLAALSRRPYQAFNIGPGFDWEQAIGGDGLRPHEIKNAQGEVVNVIPTSAQIEGPLARWVREPSVVVIQEPEGMENEAVRLHSAAGDRVGDPTKRYLTINSSAGDVSIPVHEDCLIVFTYNSGDEDVRFKTALHDRAGNFDFEYATPEEEAKRLANMATEMMNHQDIAPGLRVKLEADELMPIVKIGERARNAHHTNPSEFVDVPGARQLVHCYSDLLLQGYSDQDDDPVTTMCSMLRYILPGTENMSVDERDRKIRETLISDSYKQLHEIARAAREVGKQDSGEAPKAKPKSKSKPATKK